MNIIKFAPVSSGPMVAYVEMPSGIIGRKCAFECVLYEIVGAFLIAAQQCVGEAAQPGICASSRAARSGIASP